MNTLYSYTREELIDLVEKDGNVKIKDELLNVLQKSDDDYFVQAIKENPKWASAVWDAAKFMYFKHTQLTADDNFNWAWKVEFTRTFQKVHHNYKLFLCYDPEWFYDDLAKYNREIDGIKNNPSLLNEEDDKRIEKVQDKIDEITERHEHLEDVCFDINVNVWVLETKYKDGGTVIKFGIPSFLVSMLNDKSEHKKQYKMRMVHLVE